MNQLPDKEPLAGLRTGEAGVVIDVVPSKVSRRLMELGFVPGTLVRALRRSPLGDPIEFELRGTRISLRKADAGLIRIHRQPV